ncbi:copper resistance CopC/CopD family protein [Pollutimonas bauzanensis]|uniref:Copper transport protein n=1 Tax=Pollutimonas bauzanensis TaxID=658167 RepID=A0A1M5VZT5_9BURK|nr:copper resistance protein CopC [Pollutimonas bauzanensis]SHH80484.1 copper transport protein [Pollutimonas bauzanensis]
MFLKISGLGARRRAWRGIALVLFLLAMAAGGPKAYAHAALTASAPADGAVLAAFPRQATLTFNEPVSPLIIRLTAPDGTTRTLDRIAPVDDGLRIDLPDGAPPGTYALSWRVTSADGHPVGGALVFSLGAASAAPASAQGAAPLRQPAIWLARLALYAALFFGVGGAMSRAWLPQAARGRAAQHARLAVWLGLAAAPACLALQGLDALDAPWRALAAAAVWQAALGTTYFITLALAVLALAAARIALTASGAAGIRLAAGVAALLLGLAFAASGHASAAPPQWLARPAVWLHTLAIAAWLGALAPLFWLARGNDARLAPALRRFSRGIRWVVAALLGSGLALAWLQIDGPASLWGSAYGRILLCKLALVAVLFLLAGWNRYRLTAAALSGQDAARLALGRIIKLEAALALCVLAVVALWRFTPPPRALHAGQPAAVSAHFHSAAAMARLAFTAASADRPGRLQLTLSDANAAPLQAQAVSVAFFSPALGIEALSRQANPLGPGQWEIPSLQLPAAARWTLRIDILVSDFDRIRLEGELSLPAVSPPSSDKNHSGTEKQ